MLSEISQLRAGKALRPQSTRVRAPPPSGQQQQQGPSSLAAGGTAAVAAVAAGPAASAPKAPAATLNAVAAVAPPAALASAQSSSKQPQATLPPPQAPPQASAGPVAAPVAVAGSSGVLSGSDQAVILSLLDARLASFEKRVFVEVDRRVAEALRPLAARLDRLEAAMGGPQMAVSRASTASSSVRPSSGSVGR
jgi:hypothetical protein